MEHLYEIAAIYHSHPVYAAPETFGGIVSRYCDQYSLGIVYQEMLTGTRPFQGSNVTETVLQILTKPIPDLKALAPAASPELLRIVAKALETLR